MRIRYDQPAPDQTVFAEGMFDSQIGKEVPVYAGGSAPTVGRVVAVTVAPDGRSAELELEVDLELPTFATPAAGTFGRGAATRP